MISRMARRSQNEGKAWKILVSSQYIDTHNSASFNMQKNEEDSGQSNNIDVHNSTSFNTPW